MADPASSYLKLTGGWVDGLRRVVSLDGSEYLENERGKRNKGKALSAA